MPDGPRADRHFLACETERWFYPFNRAGGQSQNRNPAEIRCQKALVQWHCSGKSDSIRLGKTGSGESPAAVWSLFRRGKSDPGPGRGGPGAKVRSGLLRTHQGPAGPVTPAAASPGWEYPPQYNPHRRPRAPHGRRSRRGRRSPSGPPRGLPPRRGGGHPP